MLNVALKMTYVKQPAVKQSADCLYFDRCVNCGVEKQLSI
jgi:hypothetical protein